jgi:alpha-1,3-glucan synthase
LTLPAWGFKAFVPKDTFVRPSPFITKFLPGHDYRILSTSSTGDRVAVGFEFTEDMDCDSITNSLSVTSTAFPNNQTAQFDKNTVSCGAIDESKVVGWTGALSGFYRYSIELTNVFHGVHEIIMRNVTNKEKYRWTNVGLFFLMI